MDRIARRTEQWLDVFAGRALDWTLEGAARPLALDAAERAICRPGAFAVTGAPRDELVRRRRHAEELLDALDRDLANLMERRRGLVARIEACNLAIAGTGLVEAAHGDARPQRLPRRRAEHFADTMPPQRPERPASARDLRRAAVELLRATGDTLDLRELERLLRLQGMIVGGRPSHTLANALRPALVDRSIERVARGRYRAV